MALQDSVSNGSTAGLGVGCDGNVLVAPLDDELPIVSCLHSGRFICSIAVKRLAQVLKDDYLWGNCPCQEEGACVRGLEVKDREDEEQRSDKRAGVTALFDREGRLDLLSVIDSDFSTARVRADAPLGEVVLFFSLKPAHGRVFVTENGVLVGSVCSSDLSGL